MIPCDFYKVSVRVPEDHLDRMMDEITSSIEPMYPGYDRTFSYKHVTGTWRPLPGSNPYLGEVGKIEISQEIDLEFAVRKDELRNAVEAIRRIHPYEEPAIDIIPMVGWKDVLTLSDDR